MGNRVGWGEEYALIASKVRNFGYQLTRWLEQLVPLHPTPMESRTHGGRMPQIKPSKLVPMNNTPATPHLYKCQASLLNHLKRLKVTAENLSTFRSPDDSRRQIIFSQYSVLERVLRLSHLVCTTRIPQPQNMQDYIGLL